MKTPTNLFLLMMLLFYFSCGGGNGGGNNEIDQNLPEQQTVSGNFKAEMTPVNPAIMNTITVDNNFNITDTDVKVDVTVQRSFPNTVHRQQIHNGKECPTIADDTNGDGFVDAVEAQTKTDGVLIPLDSDLSSQRNGINDYPTTNADGEYVYNQSTTLGPILADLLLPDLDTDDEFVKLPPNDILDLEGIVFEIHGVPNSVNLPATVAGLNGQDPHESFPVSCGRLRDVPATETESSVR